MKVFKIGNNKVVQVFISVPMSGRSDEEIREIIYAARDNVRRILKERGVDVVWIYDNLNCRGPETPSLYDASGGCVRLHYLGEAIKKLGMSSVCYFCSGWEKAHGCRIEHAVCEEYGIERIYEESEMSEPIRDETCDHDLALLQHDWV